MFSEIATTGFEQKNCWEQDFGELITTPTGLVHDNIVLVPIIGVQAFLMRADSYI